MNRQWNWKDDEMLSRGYGEFLASMPEPVASQSARQRLAVANEAVRQAASSQQSQETDQEWWFPVAAMIGAWVVAAGLVGFIAGVLKLAAWCIR